ncbi:MULTISPECIES: peptidylprolyl isomerase [Luteibacter]|uniref:Chaperone SurA n=1 Tax=Luteibacter flocculans TaxID=2780091 RepID=A0ABY4T1F9_9GAMM|nr:MULTISPECIES: peptidylprolyl isomerase [Luteibacter]URL57940.1 peptidylprolyl isomerase [Luteibacter flocculans]SFW42747.1 peptidyl-prolyl cis-trans isomerase SurA [Luteibacter sp. UNCMF366Tsu5.1]
MKQIFAYSLLAASILVAVPSAHAQLMPSAQPAQGQGMSVGNGSLDRIVAVVEEDVILQSELDEAINAIVRQYASNPGQLPPKDVLARQVLDRLILMKLQVQRANDQGIRVSDQDVDQAAANVAQQNKMSLDQLRAAVEQDGYSYAAFRQQLSDQIIAQKLHESVVRDQVTVTDAEVNNLLASPTYKAGEVHLAHIQISTPAGGSASDIAQAQAKAEEAIKAIKGGMDFNAAAIRYSDAPDALDGGDLGWRRLDEVPPAFADAIGSLKPGETTAAMRGPTGFHILKLVETRQPGRQIVTEYHARQILIKPSEIVTPEQAEKKAEDLYTRIVDKHEDFAKLAKDESKDNTTANNGGDMGWFAKDAWGQAIATQIDQLKDNEVSHPIQTDAGWIVLQRLGTRQSDLTDQLQRDQARQAIGNRKADEAYENYLRELRSTSFVDIRVPELKDPDDKQASATP